MYLLGRVGLGAIACTTTSSVFRPDGSIARSSRLSRRDNGMKYQERTKYKQSTKPINTASNSKPHGTMKKDRLTRHPLSQVVAGNKRETYCIASINSNAPLCQGRTGIHREGYGLTDTASNPII